MFKTIVLHVDASPQFDARMALAARMAQDFEAHLVGCAVTGLSLRDFVFLACSNRSAVPSGEYEQMREAPRIHLQQFTQQAESLGVDSYESRMVDEDAVQALQLQARYADLLVVGRGDPDSRGLRGTARLPEELALHSTRPVLVVPDGYRREGGIGKITIGWNASMEATRAVQTALPLLRRASKVQVAVINPDEMPERHGEQPGADLALYLARHGVQIEVVQIETAQTTAGALLDLARSSGSDLLVAGARGHSRYREWALGGVTRDLLDQATLPLLLAH
ncbi:universal stress protein [Massilia sp. BJB1822]|uniref:universal stress protein n=1 Tax=Massilia sp. BJB1822 TaxID=2744470 RepID=UPI001593A0CB|nr:universal stress protein [Massilia sp. BJB1822]NVD97287.1 universal stress protein [Massilia sp. BJB1822]